MTTMTPRIHYGRLGLSAAITAIACFLYFLMIDALVHAPTPPAHLAGRAAVALVVGILLAFRAQREHMSIRESVWDAFILAVIVIVTASLFGAADGGRAQAIRTAGVLIGLPALAGLTHVLSRARDRISNE